MGGVFILASEPTVAGDREAKAIAVQTSDPRFDRGHVPSLFKEPLVHVGAEGEVPNLVRNLRRRNTTSAEFHP